MNEPTSGFTRNSCSSRPWPRSRPVSSFWPIRLSWRGCSLGAELSGVAPVLARCLGVALLALGLAPAFRTLRIYNALNALVLAWLGAAGQASGPLLWPVVAVHAAVALLPAWTGRNMSSPVR